MFYQSSNETILIVLNRGELLIATLTNLLSDHQVAGAFIQGIGALKDVELGYYDLEKKIYHRQQFNHEDFELISLHGNYTLKEGQPYTHLHTVLGRRDFSTLGGHLFEATVAVTAEIMVQPLDCIPKRQQDESTGLGLICGF